MPDTDYRDVQASLAGDHEAFARLVRRHQGRIAGLMWRFTRDVGECEQLVQDVFVEAFLGLAGYRGKAPLGHWLSRIAMRVGYRFWKGRAKARKLVALDMADPVCQPEARMDPSAAAELLHSLLARLKPADRLVLTLQYFQECSVEAIARQTGWTKAMVKMRAYRARKKLRQIAARQQLLEDL